MLIFLLCSSFPDVWARCRTPPFLSRGPNLAFHLDRYSGLFDAVNPALELNAFRARYIVGFGSIPVVAAANTPSPLFPPTVDVARSGHESQLVAISGLSGHVASTTALPPTADLRVSMSAFPPTSSASPPGADLPGGAAVRLLLTLSGHWGRCALRRFTTQITLNAAQT